MNNPKQSLAVGLAAVALTGAMILFSDSGTSSAVRMMQYLFLGLGLIAVIGSLIQIGRK